MKGLAKLIYKETQRSIRIRNRVMPHTDEYKEVVEKIMRDGDKRPTFREWSRTITKAQILALTPAAVTCINAQPTCKNAQNPKCSCTETT